MMHVLNEIMKEKEKERLKKQEEADIIELKQIIPYMREDPRDKLEAELNNDIRYKFSKKPIEKN